MSTEQPSEAELRAAWEEQLRLLQPADVIVQAVVSLISLAGRRLGVEPGTERERDLEQVRDAIDGARALMPVLERREDPASLGSLRDALSGLQMEYAKLAGAGAGAPPRRRTPERQRRRRRRRRPRNRRSRTGPAERASVDSRVLAESASDSSRRIECGICRVDDRCRPAFVLCLAADALAQTSW